MKKGMYMALLVLGLLLFRSAGPERAVLADGSAQLVVERSVALTFDDGPRRGTTDRLLDGLRERDAQATFFLVGEQLDGNEDLVLRMVREGHQVGNHTWSHKGLLEGDETAFLTEIRQVETALGELLGDGHYWLRPPYGQITAERMQQVETPLVKWSVDPRDWESRNADQVVEAVLEEVRPGSIILLHDIYPSSVEAALRLVDALEAQGYEFVTVEELLRAGGIRPRAGVMYRAAEGQITSKGGQ